MFWCLYIDVTVNSFLGQYYFWDSTMHPFSASNLPRSDIRTPPAPRGQVQNVRPGLTPRPVVPNQQNQPYTQQNPPRSTSNISRSQTPSQPQSNSPQVPGPDLSVLLEEIRRGHHRINSDMQKVTSMCQNIRDEFKEIMESMFTIETSVYKDALVKEAGSLFVASLTRQSSHEEIGEAIMKVLGDDGKRHKYKFTKAKTFFLNRLTDVRSEERRRLFGNKPCENFLTFTTEKFVDKFYNYLKAPASTKPTYIKNLALLRKFARECPNAQTDTYKIFRQWIDQYYPNGVSEECWGQITDTLEDRQYDYVSQSPGVGVSYEIGAGGDVIDHDQAIYQ